MKAVSFLNSVRTEALTGRLAADVERAKQQQRFETASAPKLTAMRRASLIESMLMRRDLTAGMEGMQFNGRRDLYEALGYQRTLTVKDFRDQYKRGGIAKRIIDAFPRATWSGATIIEDETLSKETAFEKAVAAFFQKHSLWATIKKADTLAGIGRYSVLVIGAQGKPDSKLRRAGSVAYFSALGEDRARVDQYVVDPSDPRFGMPQHYSISIGPKPSTLSPISNLDPSRAIHFAEGALEDEVYGVPRLEAVFNYLFDLAKNVGGGSEAAWKRMDPGMHVNIDPTLDFSEEEYDLLNREVEEFQHGYRRFLGTTGVEAKQFIANVSPFGANMDAVLRLIAATSGIPISILVGADRGELASIQVRNDWTDTILERRNDYAIPTVRKLVDRLIEIGALPKPKKYDVVWPPVSSLDQVSKAEVLKAIAAANRDQGTLTGRVIMTTNEIRREVLNLGPIEDQQDSEAIQQPVDTPGRGKASIPGARTTDVPSDSSAPGEKKIVKRKPTKKSEE